jgi:AraC-like DNA-binding protein/mannose-6-phosphate isomerase-like protein (cupin superfamily)
MADSVHFQHAGRLRPGAPWRLARHKHPFHELIVILRGTHVVDIGKERLTSRPGDVLYYPRGVSHAERSEGATAFELSFISFKGGGIPADAPLRVADARSRIRQLVEWLLDERGAYHAGAEDLRNRFTAAVVAEFVRCASGGEHGVVQRVRGYIEENLNRHIDLRRLAGVAGVSKYHFIRMYRGLTGRTPMADVRAMRLEAARDLLLTTNMPLKQIAPRVGFQSEYHLSRIFRKHFGLSARQVRTRVSAHA